MKRKKEKVQTYSQRKIKRGKKNFKYIRGPCRAYHPSLAIARHPLFLGWLSRFERVVTSPWWCTRCTIRYEYGYRGRSPGIALLLIIPGWGERENLVDLKGSERKRKRERERARTGARKCAGVCRLSPFNRTNRLRDLGRCRGDNERELSSGFVSCLSQQRGIVLVHRGLHRAEFKMTR